MGRICLHTLYKTFGIYFYSTNIQSKNNLQQILDVYKTEIKYQIRK